MKKETNAIKERIKGIVLLELMSAALWLVGIFFFYLPIPESPTALSTNFGIAGGADDSSSILFGFLIGLIILYFFRKKTGLGIFVSILLGLMIFSTASVFIPPIVALSISVLFVFVERAYRSFCTSNTLVLMGVLAGALPLAVYYKTDFLIILVVLVSFYDIAGVIFTTFIPTIAKSAADKGIPLLISAPKKGTSWLAKQNLKNTSAIMGAGDLLIPLLFLTAVSTQFNTNFALICLAGALIGNLLNILLLTKIKRGIPAMPLIAAGMLIMYYLFLGTIF